MGRRKKILIGIGAGFAALLAYLMLWPVPIEPAAWTPKRDPGLAGGSFASTRSLAAAQIIELGGHGPEDVAVDDQGRIYGGLIDGRIMRVAAPGAAPELFSDTRGRPLGLAFDAGGNLIVADAYKGLLSIAPDGTISVLSTEEGGKPFVFTDDVDVAPDGLIYFSDASSKWDRDHLVEEFFEHRPYGRLLVYDPGTKLTRLVLGGLFFANGVAVSKDGSYVLVNETSKYRIQRVWLKGPQAGKAEIFIDNLPGFPDGISAGDDGRYWVACFAPRASEMDGLLDKPWLRKVIYRLPSFVQPAPKRHGLVITLNERGEVLGTLQDPSSKSFSPITSAEVRGEWLYLGSLTYPGAARVPVP